MVVKTVAKTESSIANTLRRKQMTHASWGVQGGNNSTPLCTLPFPHPPAPLPPLPPPTTRRLGGGRNPPETVYTPCVSVSAAARQGRAKYVALSSRGRAADLGRGRKKSSWQPRRCAAVVVNAWGHGIICPASRQGLSCHGSPSWTSGTVSCIAAASWSWSSTSWKCSAMHVARSCSNKGVPDLVTNSNA